MQLFNVFALFAGIAVAAPTLTERDGPSGPSGHEVEIKDFAYGGTGCPDHSVASVLSDDRTTLTLIYDKFVAESGEKVSPRERRKNCQLNVKLHYPQGWQFSVFKADYRGYAYLPHGFSGTCSATYYFSGSSKQIISKETIKGFFDGNYIKTDVLGVESTVWSPCGAEGMLNINSEVRLSPLNSKEPALMTSDSTDLKFKQIHYLQWRKCHK